jgi:hypothetical protein
MILTQAPPGQSHFVVAPFFVPLRSCYRDWPDGLR